MDRELTETTSTVKAVPTSGSLDRNSKNPGNMMSTYGLLSDLGLDQLQHP